MPVYHRSQRLQIIDEKVDVTQLFGNRYRIVVRCRAAHDTEAWYEANKDEIFADFGTLYNAQMAVDGIDARVGEAYPNMALVSNVAGVSGGEYVVTFVYETLTDAWVQEQEDQVDSTENGLRFLTRSQVSAIDTAAPYDEDDVGVSTITDGGKTLYLAGLQDETKTQPDAQIGRFTTRWAEAGILSETIDNVGSQKSKVIETIGVDPTTPTGYSVASKQESNFEGFQTNRFTFLKDNVELSSSDDYVGSQKAITVQVFNPTAEPTFDDYSLARRESSDVEGIPTERFTFLKDNAVLSRNIQTKNGGKLIIEVVEVFNGTPVADTTGAVQIGNEVSNVNGIPTERFTFAKGDGQISVDTRPAPAQLAGCKYVTVRSLGTEVTPTGVIVAESETESDGYITYEKTALQGTIVGTKQTYKDVIEVTDAGTVNCTEVSKTAGGISGTIAVTQVTPPRTKTLAATVTVQVTTSPPNTISLAYDLGNISCSVTSISMSENFRGTDIFTTKSGNTRFSGQRKAADMSARISTYPNCYLSNSTGEGTFSYISSYENTSSSPNSIVTEAQTSTTKTFTDGTGSTSAAYATTGVVKRNSRPILTALDGTIYYEVITWSV